MLCSSARRAQETLAALALPPAVPALVRDEVYEAGPDALLLHIAETSAAVTRLLVVGHNPTLSVLAATLLPAVDRHRLGGGLAPGDLAVLTTSRPWADLGAGDATLTELLR